MRPRTWSSALVRAVEALRADFPMWGKAKLGPLLRQEGFAISNATVGRILKSLMNRGVIQPVPRLRKSPRHRLAYRRRHAIRLPKGFKPDRPGGAVQIDTVFINLAPGKAIKHFTAYDPVAKWTVAKAANRATAQATSLFLDKVLAEMPFPVKAIQVDGGSEFKAEFEEACADKGLALYELPPKRPDLNGAVERCNGSWRYEFYGVYELPRYRRGAQPAARRLPAPLQPPSAARRPGRRHPSRLSRQAPSPRDPAVSYVLSPDIRLKP